MQCLPPITSLEIALKRSNVRCTALTIVVVIFLSVPRWQCATSMTACARVPFDRTNSDGIFGCYYLVAQGGGIVGGIHEAHNEHACIVLSPDSLIKLYSGDTLYRSSKFVLSWRNYRDGRRTTLITFDSETYPW